MNNFKVNLLDIYIFFNVFKESGFCLLNNGKRFFYLNICC